MKARQLLAVFLTLILALPAHADRLRVVASFSILADLGQEIGGDRVEVVSLVGPGSDAHAFHPSPRDALKIRSANLVLINGLGFEGWMERLLAAAEFKGELVVASDGVHILRGDADGPPAGGSLAADPHAWQDPGNARTYARNIALALARVDPGGAADYLARFENFASRVEALDLSIRAKVAALPADRRRVVSSHDAFRYLGRAYGLEFLAPVGVTGEAQPSAAQVAALIRQIRAERIPAVFVESISDPRLLERIRSETGARIGGTLYSDALSPAGGEAPTYLQMMTHNLRTLVEALRP